MTQSTTFRLLTRFEATFRQGPYKHRSANLGNRIGRELFEDLSTHAVSTRLTDRMHLQLEIVTVSGEIYGRKRVRRNDSYEGERQYRDRLRPLEAKQTEERVREIHDDFDKVLILPFRATNEAPTYPFAWIDEAKTRRDYGAILTRIGSLYDERFS